MEVSIAVVVPSANRVDESRLVEFADKLCEVLLWRTISLTPSFVVDDLPM
jgi:hypothetical protein